MDQYGIGRIRRFVAVDQPAAVAAVPWMTVEEQPDSGAIFDVAGLMELGAALAGPDGEKTRRRVRGMFSGDPDPQMPAFVAEQIPDARLHVFPTEVASSHFPFLENPVAFNAVAEKFLAQGAEF